MQSESIRVIQWMERACDQVDEPNVKHKVGFFTYFVNKSYPINLFSILKVNYKSFHAQNWRLVG